MARVLIKFWLLIIYCIYYLLHYIIHIVTDIIPYNSLYHYIM